MVIWARAMVLTEGMLGKQGGTNLSVGETEAMT